MTDPVTLTDAETIPVVPKGWTLVTQVNTSPVPTGQGEATRLITLVRCQLVNWARNEMQVSAHASSRDEAEPIEDVEDRAVRRVLHAAQEVAYISDLTVPGKQR